LVTIDIYEKKIAQGKLNGKKHFNEQARLEETKQCRQAECLVRLLALLASLHSWPACLVGLPALLASLHALLACLPSWPAGLVGQPALLCACSSKWIFVAATYSTNKTKQGRLYVLLTILFYYDVNVDH
jgi:hypothetical protein